jgi:hypothetical protein
MCQVNPIRQKKFELFLPNCLGGFDCLQPIERFSLGAQLGGLFLVGRVTKTVSPVSVLRFVKKVLLKYKYYCFKTK